MKSKKHIAKTISLRELLQRFPTEDDCVAWLEEVRWGDPNTGSIRPVCPHCGGFENVSQPKSKKYTYWHKDCRKQFTVKTGTVMHSSKTSTQNWLIAMYMVLTARKGVSAMQLSKELGVQYKTAWYMLHRIREACASGSFKFSRVVEVDETYIGGKEKNKHESKKLHAGRGPVGKTPVVGIKERDGKVSAKPMSNVNKRTMEEYVKTHVTQDATIYSDEASVYDNISDGRVNHGAGEYGRGDVHTNSIEAVWSIFKRSIHGTWHHVSPKHLGRYVNEATLRLNEGNCQVDTMDRMKALAASVGGRKVGYKRLTA